MQSVQHGEELLHMVLGLHCVLYLTSDVSLAGPGEISNGNSSLLPTTMSPTPTLRCLNS